MSTQDYDLQQLVQPLLSWFDSHARILPWREEPTAYHVWVSEIMLQQTRVEAVKPYYQRFLQAFPDVETLAFASEEQLLKMWEGLGYYNRVRNMQKAAQRMIADYHGELPHSEEELLSLVGIGSYTAGAIASIAYGQPVPAVDGNVLRILSRAREDGQDVLKASVKKQIENEVRAIIPKDRAGAFNQALMELGAIVCVPNGEPKCSACPWEHMCLAHLHGTEMSYPYKAPKKSRKIEKKTILVIQDEHKTALQKRPSTGLLAGMYEFPWAEGHLTQEEVVQYVKELGFQALRVTPLENSKHIFTHKEWHMIGYCVRVDELDLPQNSPFLFLEKEETQETYPIPTAYKAYADYLNIRIGYEKLNP